MAVLYKLTDENGQTFGGCQWGEGVEHTADGEGDLCTAHWLHAYADPRLAALMYSIHVKFLPPVLWEAEGEVGLDDGLKLGCTRLKTVRRVPLPVITAEKRVRFAIYCAKEVCDDPDWNSWAEKWLSGEDTSEKSAAEAAWTPRAADFAWAAETWAAWAAAGTWTSETWAARVALWAARAAEKAGEVKKIDIFEVLEKAGIK